MSAGQRCTAAKRLIVKDSLYDALLSQVKKIADRLIVGEPHSQPAPFMGPVIDNQAADGLTESFLVLMSNGGKTIKHMARPIEGRPIISPAIIHVTDMTERPGIELFSPLFLVVRVRSLADANGRANKT